MEAGHSAVSHEEGGPVSGTREIVATVLIAVAAILTAWAAFEHAKWNGVQTEHNREATQASAAASRATTIATTQRNVDVESFLGWLQAAHDDIRTGRVDPSTSYTPDPGTLSGFIALRFRAEFKPAFEAWTAARPLVNSNAPATPFQMREYAIAEDAEVERLLDEQENHSNLAHKATTNSDNYVLVTVLFAIALVFISLGSKLNNLVPSNLLLGFAAVAVLLGVIALATFPVDI